MTGVIESRRVGGGRVRFGPCRVAFTMEDIPQYKTNGKTYLLYYYLYYYPGCWLPSPLIPVD